MVADSEPPPVFRVIGKPGFTAHERVAEAYESRFTIAFEPAARLVTQSWLLLVLHRASPVLVARASTTVPVSLQVWVVRFSSWMVTGPLELTMRAHHAPSRYHSLLWGLSCDGEAT